MGYRYVVYVFWNDAVPMILANTCTILNARADGAPGGSAARRPFLALLLTGP